MAAEKHAMLRGLYADFRLVKTRSVAQIVIEIPIESAGQFHDGFGFPLPGQETWVAIARLNAGAPASPPAPEPKRSIAPLTPAARAALVCKNADFIAWVNVKNEDEAADYVRWHCGVGSRSELNDDKEARSRFEALLTEFDAQTPGRMAEMR